MKGPSLVVVLSIAATAATIGTLVVLRSKHSNDNFDNLPFQQNRRNLGLLATPYKDPKSTVHRTPQILQGGLRLPPPHPYGASPVEKYVIDNLDSMGYEERGLAWDGTEQV